MKKEMTSTIIKPGIGFLDHFFSEKLVLPTLGVWKALGFTPNGLTTLGLLSSIGSLYCFQKNKLKLASLLVVARMYFDYADGLFARKYEMSSQFGDYYDHFVDLTFLLGFVYTMWIKGYKRHAYIVLMIVGVLFCFNMACIENECKDCKHRQSLSVLDIFKAPCGAHNWFKIIDNSWLYAVMIGIVMHKPKPPNKNKK